jgi:hypothetical protein
MARIPTRYGQEVPWLGYHFVGDVGGWWLGTGQPRSLGLAVLGVGGRMENRR